MEQLNLYTLIISASTIILISFVFNGIARRTNVPSVVLLIGLGLTLQYLLGYFGIRSPDFSSTLEVLGILGLMMIILEAAMDLKLKRDKLGIIFQSFVLGLVGLLGSAAAAGAILFYMIPDMSWPQVLLYATPLSIMSSSIIIPSVSNLPEIKKEFQIYESTFSVILGIILFYLLIVWFEIETAGVVENLSSNFAKTLVNNTLITLIISLAASYLLLFTFQRIKEEARLSVLISMLLLQYAIAKKFDLSPLIIILVFGLVVSNSKLFFVGPFRKMLNPARFRLMEHGLRGLAAETAFIVRTFFFVIFGASILLSSLYDLELVKISLSLVGSIIIIRIILLRIFIGKDISPQIWIAPRGLITVLLFYAIPATFQTELFNPGILLIIIISTGIIMTFGLVSHSLMHDDDEMEEGDLFLDQHKKIKHPIPGTDFTLNVEPRSKTSRWILRLRSLYRRKVILRILKMPLYRKTVRAVVEYIKRRTKKLGIKPIFSSEKKIFGKRLQTVIRIWSHPEGVKLRDNPDYKALKKYVHRVIFEADTLEGILFDIAIFTLIVLSVSVVMIQSVGGIPPFLKDALFILELIITIIFTLEYGLRIWTSEKRRKYIFSTFGIVDLLSILPLFLELLFQNIHTLGIIRLLRLLRIFRVLKLVRFIGEADVLLKGLRANANKIFVFLFFVIIVCTIMGALMFVIEGGKNGFTSIPRGIYWAVVTLTTVGYGDISPSTPVGQLIAMTLMILGYGVIAVPAGLVAAGVAASIKEKMAGSLRCPRCNQRVHLEESNYCRVCGTRLDSKDEEKNNKT